MENYLKEEKSKMLELVAWRFARMMRYKDVEDLRNHSVGVITDLNTGDSEVCFQGEEHKRLFGEFRPFHSPKDVEEHFNGKNIILPQFEEGFFRLLDCNWLIQQFKEAYDEISKYDSDRPSFKEVLKHLGSVLLKTKLHK